MSTMAFRLPQSVRSIFEDRVLKLAAGRDPGIQNATDALQDAVVKWVMIEEAQDLEANMATADRKAHELETAAQCICGGAAPILEAGGVRGNHQPDCPLYVHA